MTDRWLILVSVALAAAPLAFLAQRSDPAKTKSAAAGAREAAVSEPESPGSAAIVPAHTSTERIGAPLPPEATLIAAWRSLPGAAPLVDDIVAYLQNDHWDEFSVDNIPTRSDGSLDLSNDPYQAMIRDPNIRAKWQQLVAIVKTNSAPRPQ